MKKLLGIVMSGLLAAGAVTAVNASAGISVVINDKPVEFGDVAPQIIEGRTMVPLRAIFEALNATVEWDDVTKTVKSAKDDTTISFTIGENKLIKNGEEKTLDVPAQIVDSRTLVPVRAISEAFDCNVEWEDSAKTVKITYADDGKNDGDIITLANAEPVTENVAVYAGDAVMTIVEAERNSSNHVYNLVSNVTDRASWTYFWYKTNDYKAGQKYKIEYDVRVTGNALNVSMSGMKVQIGTCLKYSTSDGENNKEHGVGGITFEQNLGDWAHVNLIAEIPENYVNGDDTRFGIYGNPIITSQYDHQIALNFQLDNVSVVPYGNTDKTAEPSRIDFEKLSGVVYDFKTDQAHGWTPTNSKIGFDGEDMVVTSDEGSTDPHITANKLSIKAGDYNAVVVRFKPDATVGAKQANAYFATDTETAFSEDRGIYLNFSDMYTDDEGYKWAVFKFGDNPSWIGTVTGIRFDPVSAAGGVHRIDKIIVTKI